MSDLHEKLLQNYSRFLMEDIEEEERWRSRHRPSGDDTDTKEEEADSHPNPFHNKEIWSLSRWRRTVTALLDAEDKPLRERIDIFHTMSKAYTAVLSSLTTSAPNTSPIRSAFINYLLHAFTQEALDNTRRGRPIPEKVTQRLKTIARLWFHALLQGFETCQLVGFHEKEPWAVWEKMQMTMPIPELWTTMVLQYYAYEVQYNYIYGSFLIEDMHFHRTSLKTEDGEGTKGSAAESDFIKQTYGFRAAHDEALCFVYPGNPLFQRRVWRE
jgi:hypothetical protein